MRIVLYALVTGIAAVVTYGLAILIWKLSTKYRLYPKIRERDVHTRPTPRLGGVAMFLGMVVAFGVASQVPELSLVFSDAGKVLGILGAALIIVLIGVADDIWDLDWVTKLAGQIIAAGVLAWQGVQLQTLPIGGQTIVSPYISLIITVLAVVLVMNAINFIDGLDGLVAGVAISYPTTTSYWDNAGNLHEVAPTIGIPLTPMAMILIAVPVLAALIAAASIRRAPSVTRRGN